MVNRIAVARTITVKGSDGKPTETGLDFRYGIGETPNLADAAQVRSRTSGGGARDAGAGQDLGQGPGDGGEAVHGRQQPGAGSEGHPDEVQSQVAAPGGKLSRRIFRDRRTPTNFIVPETPEFAENKTGDLSRFPDTAAKRGIKPLPIRLPVGLARGDHRGFGVEHMAQNGEAYPSREPPQYTDDRAENYARHSAAIARSGNEGYIEGDKVILRSSRMGEALVLKEREDSTGHYYSIVTTVPAEKSRWGDRKSVV